MPHVNTVILVQISRVHVFVRNFMDYKWYHKGDGIPRAMNVEKLPPEVKLCDRLILCSSDYCNSSL